MAKADEAIVYFNKETIKHKKLEELTENDVQSAFGTANLKVFTSSNKLLNYLKSKNWKHKNLLMMSSGNFDGIDFNQLGVKIIN
jgi:UDP-N-acetylmuramate: L-alanyl-gamma-D-glutamyl-meso-diaminopimelate ligase